MEVRESVQETIGARSETHWDYQYFKEYLLGLARSPNKFLIRVEDYPDTIELNPNWHALLDQMRQETYDREYWAMVGFKNDRRDVYLSRVPIPGDPHQIPSQLIRQRLERAQKQAGIVDLVGDIHSHPVRLRLLRPAEQDHYTGFSPGDLFNIVVRNLPMMCLVDGDKNFMAFASRKSWRVKLPRWIQNQRTFSEYWVHNRGIYTYQEAIARKYHLVPYRGDPDKDLVKIFPPPKSA